MCFDYDGYPEFAQDRVVTARKPHRCNECYAMIAKGQDYYYHSGKYDGNFYSYKVCRRCSYDRVRVVEHELAEGCDWSDSWPPLGGLVQHLHDSELGQTKPEDVPASFQVGDNPRELSRKAP